VRAAPKPVGFSATPLCGWHSLALGGKDAAVSNALAGVLPRKTPKLKIRKDADFEQPPN